MEAVTSAIELAIAVLNARLTSLFQTRVSQPPNDVKRLNIDLLLAVRQWEDSGTDRPTDAVASTINWTRVSTSVYDQSMVFGEFTEQSHTSIDFARLLCKDRS